MTKEVMPRLFFHSLLIACVFCSSDLQAQKIDHFSVSATTETYAFPFTRFLPLHPGVEVGMGVFRAERSLSEHNINVLLGGYHHKKIENAIYVRSEYVYRFNIKNVVSIDGPLGIGYQHAFYPGETYQQNTTTVNGRLKGKQENLTF